jgi:hypothetical protein
VDGCLSISHQTNHLTVVRYQIGHCTVILTRNLKLDAIEDQQEEPSDLQDPQSEASMEDPTWRPTNRSTLKDRRKRNSTMTEPVQETRPTKRNRCYSTRAQRVARKDLESGTLDHEQIKDEHGDEMPRSTTLETAALSQSAHEQIQGENGDEIPRSIMLETTTLSQPVHEQIQGEHGNGLPRSSMLETTTLSQSTQVHNSTPAVEERPILLYREESLQFASLCQKARASEAILCEIEDVHRERRESLWTSNDSMYLTYLDTYEDNVFSQIWDELEETCTRQIPDSQDTHSSGTADSDRAVDYSGKRWEFKSLQDKAEALEAILDKVVGAVVKFIDLNKKGELTPPPDEIKRAKRSEGRKLAMYFEGDFLLRIRVSLRKNGAKIVR